ncbi:hypothetical protein NDA11_004051 [Ustilago hordei]|uniref:Uncharacterized protein n=1 Tax=Ustilago hordei TaxID=120017 RepID=I2FSY8_USTHO|nr:hypothetical protein NDA10_005770 [Ustilago hordei]KAJ1570789.1 hypothetical protein NDA11_004051 [Ustilago hordei]KAJ1587146.1 hypothetical protein NDA15_002497 [Ustilago hordei]KAJ1589794.1 hypothetical protein NDA12_000964 [Ustilago hordei]UTT96557.1 hypothetical protein NDA17_007675 [Ustilago hordei]
MQAALQVIKYLNQMQSKVLRLGGKGRNALAIVAYTDSNWALDPHTNRRSTSGSIIKVFISLVTWNSHVQKCMLNSAVEAEYVVGSVATCEALFQRHLICGLGFGDHILVVLMDNTGCTQVAKEQALHSKLKHIDTKNHLIQHHVLEGDIAMRYVRTEDNIADYLTKPVSQCHRCHRVGAGSVHRMI